MDSKLQIISGRFRGRKLRMPASARPTQNRARIALFNMLASLGVAPKNVWDAFAGSGAFGLEILSRYPAANVVFTDTDADAIKIIRGNLADLNIGTRAVAVQADAVAALNKYGASADLIFLDPPYADAAAGRKIAEQLAHTVPRGAILIWEQDAVDAIDAPAGWGVLRDKKYGRARFLVLQAE